MEGIEKPAPLNDELLYEHYLARADKMGLPKDHPIYKKWSCDAVRLHTGENAWASMLSGRGIVGMYNYRHEAMLRALVAALMFEDEKEGKLPEIKKKLEAEKKAKEKTEKEETQPKEASDINIAEQIVDAVMEELPSKSPDTEVAKPPAKSTDTELKKPAPSTSPESPVAAAKKNDEVMIPADTKNTAKDTDIVQAQTTDSSKNQNKPSPAEPSADKKTAPAIGDKQDSDDGTETDDSESGKQKDSKGDYSPKSTPDDEKVEKAAKTVGVAPAAASSATPAAAAAAPVAVPPLADAPVATAPVDVAPPVTAPPITDHAVVVPHGFGTPPAAQASVPNPLVVASPVAATTPVPATHTAVAPVTAAAALLLVALPAHSVLASDSPAVSVPDSLSPTEPSNSGEGDNTKDAIQEVSKDTVESLKRKLGDGDQAKVTAAAKRVKTIELRDPVSGIVQAVFSNATNASETTEITRYKIIKACQDGGGLVGGQFFRYQQAMEDDDDEEQDSVRPTGIADDKPMPDEPISKRSEASPASKTSESAKTAILSHQSSIHHALLAGNTQKGRALPMATGRAQHQPVKLTPRKSMPSPSLAGIHHKLPPQFHLSSLKAVRKKTNPAKRPKRIIELIELRTNKVVVCFRGATDVCRALDLDRKDVTKACDSEEKRSKKQLSFKNGTFALRYAKPGKIEAYIYGDHREDYLKKGKIESHKEVAKRFKDTYITEKASDTLGQLPDFLSASEKLTESPGPMPATTSATATASARPDFAELVEEGDMIEGKVDFATATAGLDATALCLVCQSVPPHIVFEPCFHAVLCSACAEVACRSFCPLCQTKIEHRIQPKTAVLVRPRIFSAYSFM